jgi:hypothetical protein
VVGALGAASTLSAGADEIPGAPDTSATVAAAADTPTAAADTPTPPPVLPWGARPEKIRKGKPGASSSSLRAAGLDAAAPDTSGSTTPRAKYGPKGRTTKTTFLKNETTDVAPPAPPPAGSTVKAAKAAAEVNYLYNVGSQAALTDGIYTNVTIGKPELAAADYHSLGELALQSADGNQIIEVGWTVDRLVNGDDDPHLFVYHWVNRQTSCYNGCGFQAYSTNVTAGATLSYDVTKKFGIQFFDNAWWIAFDSEWIGFFPATLWSLAGISFNKSGLVQVFGEVAASSAKPCTEMGNGLTPDNENAAKMASITYLNGPTVTMNIRSTTDVYAVNALSLRTFRYGGPGAC